MKQDIKGNTDMFTNTQVYKRKTQLLPIQAYFKENLRTFFTETSLNGLKYIADVQRSIWERGYYFISFSIAFTFGLYMVLYFLNKWQSTPVIIGMSSKATYIKDMPFPAVTFCNMNQALASKVKNIKPDTPEYAMLHTICFQNYNYSGFENFQPRFKDENFASFKLQKAQNCSSMFIYCKFGPNEEPCTNIFREIYLDEGICCIFNRLHPYFLYKVDYKFIRDYTSLNGRMSYPVNWNWENGYKNPLPKSYYPRKALGPGVSMGLTVILNAEIDEYFCSSTNGEGFKVLLYSPVDSPNIKEFGIPVMLGHQTRLRISTKLLESEPALRTISPKDRQCYFLTEKKLLSFKYYTKRYCEAECVAARMLRDCNCIPSDLPQLYTNVSRCFLGEMDCVRKAERSMFNSEIFKCKAACLPSCNDLSYRPQAFATPLAKTNFILETKFLQNISKKIMRKNLAVVKIYYAHSNFRSNVRMPYTGLTEFLSQTGGIMSLMVGFSVISVFEMLYFVLLKPFLDMIMKRSPSVLDAKDDEFNRDNNPVDHFHRDMLFKRRKNNTCNINRVMNWDKNELQKHRNDKY